MQSYFYADCCLFNEQFDVGIAVLTPLVADLQQQLSDPAVTEQAADFYREKIDLLDRLLGELQMARARSTMNTEDESIQQLGSALGKALQAIWARNPGL